MTTFSWMSVMWPAASSLAYDHFTSFSSIGTRKHSTLPSAVALSAAICAQNASADHSTNWSELTMNTGSSLLISSRASSAVHAAPSVTAST